MNSKESSGCFVVVFLVTVAVGCLAALLALLLPKEADATATEVQLIKEVAKELPVRLPVIKLGLSSYSGHCILGSAALKAQLEKERIDLQTRFDSCPAKIAALKSGRLDAAVLPLSTFIDLGEGCPASIAYAICISSGADGVVGTPVIESIPQLNNREAQIYYVPASSSELLCKLFRMSFTLDRLPHKPGTMDDPLQQLKHFQENKDKAYAYAMHEPWLSKIRLAGGHILMDSSKQPKLFVDVLVVRNELLESPKMVQLLKSYTGLIESADIPAMITEAAARESLSIDKETASKIAAAIQWKSVNDNLRLFGLKPGMDQLSTMNDVLKSIMTRTEMVYKKHPLPQTSDQLLRQL